MSILFQSNKNALETSGDFSKKDFSEAIFNWYQIHQRNLPWRLSKDPYLIWLSEIMLQQTTVSTVMGYFEKFTQKFPTVDALANASEDEVFFMWQGLGYYSRARHLHATAKQIVELGFFPSDSKTLQKLKGIGPYTAAAIASIAFEERILAFDGNLRRVLSRYFTLDEKGLLEKMPFSFILPDQHIGDFNQALMDLGSLVCRPKNPSCDQCPLQFSCLSYQKNETSLYPPKKKKPEIKTQNLYAIMYINTQKKVFIYRNNESSLLKNLYTFPLSSFPLKGAKNLGQIKHLFTHIKMHVTLLSINDDFLDASQEKKGHWVSLSEILDYPLSSLMKKLLEKVTFD